MGGGYVIILLLILGCQTNAPDPKKMYKKNMLFTVNGVRAKGIHVAEKSNVFNIKANFPEKIDHLELNTCHRYFTAKKVGKSWDYFYKKAIGIEDIGVCAMSVIALEDEGSNAWALIEYKNDNDYTLEAEIRCNGDYNKSTGVSICQSQQGLRQSVKFLVDTKSYDQDECSAPYTYDNRTYYYNIERGDCIYLFKHKKELHRHRTYGYDVES
tara:strand:+ start:2519 stop:3154 length:636 start_codon:yes stop_codon:yes gene_type:complete